MGAIEFTQFKRPDGRAVPVWIDRPDKIVERAQKIIARGFRFECEHLEPNMVSLTISKDDGDHAIEVVPNGPEVPLAVDHLITNFLLPDEATP